MRHLVFVFVRIFSVLALTALLVVGAVAQQSEADSGRGWQDIITHQIEAFRRGDAETALSLADSSFHTRYGDAKRFYVAIMDAGYGPILDSRSHSFGEFSAAGEKTVLQVVRLQGPNQGLFEALYHMREGPDGWRVQGVQLRPTEGVGV